MSDTLPTATIVAGAAVVVSLISGMLATVNLTLSKEQKVSEFRQTWIDGLREDLSKFFSSLRFLAELTNASTIFSAELLEARHPGAKAKEAELRVQAMETFTRVKLRLNWKESEHIEFLKLLNTARSECMATEGSNLSKAFEALERAVDYARPVLKSEWKRVKKGEPTFRWLRYSLIFLIIVMICLFILFLLGWFK